MKKSSRFAMFVLACVLLSGMVTPGKALGAVVLEKNAGAPQFQAESTGRPGDEYWEAIQRTAGMVGDPQVRALASEYGLDLVNLTWEDTGRYDNSAVGPNISDMTIQVEHRNPGTGQSELTLMPVIRFPNFSDRTADIDPENFFLLVGNQDGESLRRISLSDYLGNFRSYLSEPDSWTGREMGLLATRDSHVLVSAQAAFLPVPEDGEAQFNPVLFNYQSYAGDPAVLAIVATREGTSATVIDNLRDAFPAGFSWGQRLFFNQAGERASFTGQRLSEFGGDGSTPGGRPGSSGERTQAAGETGLNMVLLIQVPLKQKSPPERGLGFFAEGATAPMAAAEVQKSDVEAAVVGHGKVEGPFTEIDGLDIERDPRFPIRVTVQFYKATSNGVVSAADMAGIAAQIQRVYAGGDYVGSLVVDGPSSRPTEYDGPKDEPPGWWEAFWQRFEGNTGLSRDEAIFLLHSLGAYAGRWLPTPRPVEH